MTQFGFISSLEQQRHDERAAATSTYKTLLTKGATSGSLSPAELDQLDSACRVLSIDSPTMERDAAAIVAYRNNAKIVGTADAARAPRSSRLPPPLAFSILRRTSF